jgi:membrane protease YdiL (CAAX protease family)
MRSTRTLRSRISKVVVFGILSFVIAVLAGVIWSALLITNLRTSAAIPWSVPVMAAVLWAIWQYLAGKGWPRSTAEARRRYLRANLVSRRTFLWALAAGTFSVVALAGLWIVMFQMVKMPGNVLPDMSKYPPLTAALMILMGSLVSPFMEEGAFRGYFQVVLEREFSGPVAVLISSGVFALGHFNHGLLWPKLLVYFLAGVAFGVIAFLTKSTLPAIPVHFIGDMTFFALVWPHDTARKLIWQVGADRWFWIHAAQAIVFAALAICTYKKLAKIV